MSLTGYKRFNSTVRYLNDVLNVDGGFSFECFLCF